MARRAQGRQLTTDIFLVRHGQTDWNKEKRTQGHMDMPLNGLGYKQARALAPVVQALHQQRAFAALVSSDLARAVATVEPTAIHLGLAVQLDSIWRERHFGVLEGLTQEQMQREQPLAFAGWRGFDAQFQIPGGESLQQLVDRVGRGVSELTHSYSGKRVLVMTHGGVIDAAARYFGFLDQSGPRNFVIANTCISQFTFDGRNWSQPIWVQADHVEESE
jgi:2,3-bisphosphoglycerate-dependent phosphoglycerate mutase